MQKRPGLAQALEDAKQRISELEEETARGAPAAAAAQSELKQLEQVKTNLYLPCQVFVLGQKNFHALVQARLLQMPASVRL